MQNAGAPDDPAARTRRSEKQERVMTKTRKFPLVALGDAKRLTKGGFTINVELDSRPQKNSG